MAQIKICFALINFHCFQKKIRLKMKSILSGILIIRSEHKIYDDLFIHGRKIFESKHRNVDEMYNF